MSDIARATIVGRLTRDPELNSTGKVLKLGIASNYRQKNQAGDWEEAVSYFDVKVFGNRATGLAGFLAKGRQVAVDARVVQERWTNDSGDKRSAVMFYADEVIPLGNKDENSGRNDNGTQTDFPITEPAVVIPDDDGIPF